MISYLYIDNKFSLVVPGNEYSPGNMRQESDRRAREIAKSENNIIISLSSGIDSQSVVHSFYTQGIPFETAFLYCPGYNEIEFEQLQIVKKKYNLDPVIVVIDPYKVKEQVIYESELHNIQRNQIFQKLFLEQLPDNYTFIQMAHDPCVYVNRHNDWLYFQGYHSPEVARDRAFSLVKRSGKYIFYGATSEFLYSILTDDIYKAALYSREYYDGNGLQKPGTVLKTVDRWDYYIKPLLYGKYWGDELIYFPKYAGFENVQYLAEHRWQRENVTLIPYQTLIDNMSTGIDMTYDENFNEVISE